MDWEGAIRNVINWEVLVARLDTVRNKTAKVTKRMGPRAVNARESATDYAAGRLGPRVDAARHAVAPRLESAKDAVVPRLEHAREVVTPRLEHARDAVAPRLEHARESLGPHLGSARDKVRGDLLPKVAGAATAALAASAPVREEAKARGSAAMAALKGDLTPAEVRNIKAARRTGRRRRLLFFLLLGGLAAGAWSWWKRQSEPEWTIDEFREGGTAASTVPSGAPGTWAVSDEEAAGGPVGEAALPSDAAGANPEEILAEGDTGSAREESPASDGWRSKR